MGERERAWWLTAAFLIVCGVQAVVAAPVQITSGPHHVLAAPGTRPAMLLLCAGLILGLRPCWWLLTFMSAAACVLAALTVAGFISPYLVTLGAAHIAGSASAGTMLATVALGAAGTGVLLSRPVRARQRPIRAFLARRRVFGRS